MKKVLCVLFTIILICLCGCNAAKTNTSTTPVVGSSSASEYKAKCRSFDYGELLKDPDRYKGEYAFFKGEISVLGAPGSHSATYLLQTGGGIVYVEFSTSQPLSNGDGVIVYGQLNGLGSINPNGGAATVPRIDAAYCDLTTDVIGISVYGVLTVVEGGSETLSYEIYPKNAVDKTLKWTSADESVATVDNRGTVYGVKEGTTTIKAESANGVYGTCIITVTKRSTLSVPSTPLALSKFADGSYVPSLEWHINDISYQFSALSSDTVSLSISLSGEKAYDSAGLVASNLNMIYELVDNDGYFYYSGSIMVGPLKMGEKFKDVSFVIFNLKPGDYELTLKLAE